MPVIAHSPEIIRYEIPDHSGHPLLFSTTRRGGYSTGSYGGFNLSPYTGDDPEAVDKNRTLLFQSLSIEKHKFFMPYQIHGTEVIHIDRNFTALSSGGQSEALNGKDALITDLKDVCIAVSTADCVPVLLFSEDCKAAGAIHAGWRGTCARIVQKTLREMVDIYECDPAKMHAIIGPSISPEVYEVGDEVRDTFEENGFEMKKISFFNEKTYKHHIDLWEANRLQLTECGIPDDQILISGMCTYSHPERFFSARQSGIQSGRMLTGICIKS